MRRTLGSAVIRHVSERVGLARPRNMRSGEKIVRANGVDLCAETFGRASDPALLLIHGAVASLRAWDEELCARLAGGGRFVIRYDHRDQGQSVSYPPGRPGYGLPDLAADALGLLDAFGIERAHLVGRSLGGSVAVLAALARPERVSTLTLVATSPGGAGLPAPSPEFLAQVQAPPADEADLDASVERRIAMLRVFSAGSAEFDAERMRPLVAQDLARTRNVASSQQNHFVMPLGAPLRPRLSEVRQPALVIHGARDPVFPLEHARAFERELPHVHLLVLDGVGHDLPRSTWDRVVPAILKHTS
jgi:pimeloyl-ACP methyl ester carboxylesterase